MERPAGEAPASPVAGRVIGTEPATPLEFWVGVGEGTYLQLDDVVVVDRVLPDGQPLRISGRRVAGAGHATRAPASTATCSSWPTACCPPRSARPRRCMATRFEPEIYVPPLPGEEVRKATGAERDEALLFTQMRKLLPAGLSRDDEPFYLNLEFLDGTRGAHVNISGVSGVATKTTYATFLLYSLFHSGVLGAEAANTKALIFNVKGEDLLFLDHTNVDLKRRPAGPLRPARPAGRRRSSRWRSSPRPSATTPTPAPTSPPASATSPRSSGRSRSSAARSCCRSCSPTPRTTASSTRWSCTTWSPGCATPSRWATGR